MLSTYKNTWDLKEKKKLLGMVSVNEEKLKVNKSSHSPKKKKKHQIIVSSTAYYAILRHPQRRHPRTTRQAMHLQ